MNKRQSSSMFIVSLIISGTIFLEMALYLISKVAGWDVRYNLVAVCQSWMKTIGLSTFEYGLDAFVIYTLVFTIWKIGSHFYHASRM